MAVNPNEEDPWKKYKEATCLINSQGTGYFLGKGWVMSVAHNFQNDNTHPKKLHDLLSAARFRFTVDGQPFDFPPEPPQGPIRRTAFIHHLRSGNNNMDIAMVKLGKQYEYGNRQEYQDWETAEDSQLQRMPLQSIFDIIRDTQTALNDTVYPRPRSMALMRNRDIQPIRTRNVPIIAEIDNYMAHTYVVINQRKAENARQDLERMARDWRLTIYLMDGKVISAPQADDNRRI